MHRTRKSKTCVWRWQERFMEEGFDGLLRDKTRPAEIQTDPLARFVEFWLSAVICGQNARTRSDTGQPRCFPKSSSPIAGRSSAETRMVLAFSISAALNAPVEATQFGVFRM
jgi:hypothetical protein